MKAEIHTTTAVEKVVAKAKDGIEDVKEGVEGAVEGLKNAFSKK